MQIKNKLYFWELTPEEGNVITDWNKNDIVDYAFYKIVVCPLDTDLNYFYEITEEENEEYLRQQEIAIKDK